MWEQTVVEEFSAFLEYKDEIRVPLNGDHCSIAKYSSEKDNNYKIVSGHLALMVRDATEKGKRKLNELDSLS